MFAFHVHTQEDSQINRKLSMKIPRLSRYNDDNKRKKRNIVSSFSNPWDVSRTVHFLRLFKDNKITELFSTYLSTENQMIHNNVIDKNNHKSI